MIEGLEEHLEIYETKYGFKKSRWVCNAKDVEKATEDLQQQNKNLKEEVKDLKKQLKQRTAQSDANANLWMKELKREAEQEKEIENLRGSLLNLRFGYAYAMRRLFSGTNPEKYEFWKKLQTKFRKAKKKLKH